MAVPLSWLVSRRELALRMLTPIDGVDRAGSRCEIDIAVTTELADPTPWLSGGELVLTTGIGPADVRADEYVARLVDRGVAALGYGTGFAVPQVPVALVEAATQHGLPLLEVPLPTPFVAIARAIADRIGEQSHRAVAAAARAQPRMTRAAMVGGPAAVLRELATACQGSVVLTDRRGGVLDSRPAGLAAAALARIADDVRSMDGRASSVNHSADGSVVVHRIGESAARTPGRTHGFLAVLTDHRPLPSDQVLIGHASSLLALHFERPRRAAADGWLLNEAALGLLVTGSHEGSVAWDLVATAADADGRVSALVLAGPLTAVAPSVAALRGRLAAAGAPVFVWSRARGAAGEVVAVVPAEDASDDLLLGLDSAHRRRIRAGLSRPHPLAELTSAVQEAHRVAVAAEPGGRIEHAAAMTGRLLLGEPSVRAALHEVARQSLGPLEEHDRRHATQLVASLRAYLECHGQWEMACTQLGVHRHTLRARIARVEEVAGIDLGSATVRAELLLALLA